MKYYAQNPKEWVFYYTKDGNRLQEELLAVWTGKQPQRTNLWKGLQQELNSNDITSCGYMLKDDWMGDRDSFYKSSKV